MEIKAWSYEEFPDFTEEVLGAERMATTGEEMGVHLRRDVEYARAGGVWCFRFWSHFREMLRTEGIRAWYLCRVRPGRSRMFTVPVP